MIYRKKEYYKNENYIYKEMQVYNENEFVSDKSTFDKLCRMQHYDAPTRLLDISSDIMSAIYFAVHNTHKEESINSNAIIYIFEINQKDIKHYDSDAVSVVANLAKLHLKKSKKSKKSLVKTFKKNLTKTNFNTRKSVKFLQHEIREEKSHFLPLIKQEDLSSVLCVRSKYTNNRIRLQKGLFFLFGLNSKDYTKSIQLLDDKKNLIPSTCNARHPIKVLHQLLIPSCSIEKIRKELSALGITTPHIVPEVDDVSKYLKEELEKKNENK